MEVIDKLVMFHVAVNDMDRTKEFYAGRLGFKVTADKEYGGRRWVSMEFPGGGTSVNFTTAHENMTPGSMKLYLSSPDVEATYQELVSEGVRPAREIADDWGRWNGSDQQGKWFEINDPDGNRLLVIPAA